jgi:hypothetical protein
MKLIQKHFSNRPCQKQWEGWGTALKPAHEPMVLARKPLIGTVAANVLTYGTGGLNIDGARVAYQGDYRSPAKANGDVNSGGSFGAGVVPFDDAKAEQAGRWPANVIHDGSDEVVALFPEAKGKVGMKIRWSDFTFSVGDKVETQSLQVKQDLVTVAAPPDSFTAPRRASATGMRGWMGLRKSVTTMEEKKVA